MVATTVTLPSGDELPRIGFGTWNLREDTVQEPLRTALDVGYTHIDTAEGYWNEDAIGEVLAEYDRDELFLTSKVLPKKLNYESLITAFESTLDRLGTEYLDLYLIHWPNPAISIRETMEAMATLKQAGRIKNIGVSNFSAYQLSAAHHVSDVPVAVNQVEFHPWHYRDELLEYCKETDTVLEAAAPLARSSMLDNPTLEKLAEKYGKSPAQIVLRWAIEKEVVVLPKSSTPEHIKENYKLFDWELSDEDHCRIDDLDRGEPVYDVRARSWDDETWGISK